MFAAGRNNQEVNKNANSNETTDWLQVGQSYINKNDKVNEPKISKREDKHLTDHDIEHTSNQQIQTKWSNNNDINEDNSTKSQQIIVRRSKSDKHDKKRKKKYLKDHYFDTNDSYTSSDSEEHNAHQKKKEKAVRKRKKDKKRAKESLKKLKSHTIYSKSTDISFIDTSTRTLNDINQLFRIDSHGDPDNSFYGSLYVHEKPIYNLNAHQFNGVRKKKYEAKNYQSKPLSIQQSTENSRYFSPESQSFEGSGPKRLHLAYSAKRLKRIQEKETCSSDSHHELSYIPLDPIIEADEDLTQNFMQTETENMEQYIVAETKKFNMLLSESPNNVDAWLDFILFQDKAIRLNNHSRERTESENGIAIKHVIFTKQKAILNKALLKNPSSEILKSMNAKIQLLDEPNNLNSSQSMNFMAKHAMEDRIEEMIRNDWENLNLWRYLHACKTSQFSSCTISSLREFYARIFSIFRSKIQTGFGLSCKNNSELLEWLLDWHFVLCIMEQKAGYTERALAYNQSIYDFNYVLRPVSDRHNDILTDFNESWDEFRLRDTCQIQWKLDTKDVYVPSEDTFSKFLTEQKRIYQQKMCIIPNSIVSIKHTAKSPPIQFEDSTCDVIPSISSETLSEEALVYSNLHGMRINMRVGEHANESQEYQRILRKVRESKPHNPRSTKKTLKVPKQNTLCVHTDERPMFENIPIDDPIVLWCLQEVQADIQQWFPLDPHNSMHLKQIELTQTSPDRAVLKSELLPFLINTPVSECARQYQWRLLVQLLHLLGVQFVFDSCTKYLAATNFVDNLDAPLLYDLIEPILDALNSERKDYQGNNKIFLTVNDRIQLLQRDILYCIYINKLSLKDPSKVQKIRQLFSRAIEDMTNVLSLHELEFIQALWLEYEFCLVSDTDNDTITSIAYKHAKNLCQSFVSCHDEAHPPLLLLFTFAKLEAKQSNIRQSNKICEVSLSTLELCRHFATTNISSDRRYHMLLFLRCRNEFAYKGLGCVQWSTRKLFILYTLWQPLKRSKEKFVPLDTLRKSFRGNISGFEEYLKSIFDRETQENMVDLYRKELDAAKMSCNNYHDQSCASKSWYCIVGYAIHNLALVTYTVNGYNAACQVYKHNIDCDQSAQSAYKCLRHQKNWLYLCFLEFMQLHKQLEELPYISPREWRHAVYTAVRGTEVYVTANKYKSARDALGYPLFYRLFVDAENGCVMSQTLQSYIMERKLARKRLFERPSITEWLFALLCEITRVERSAGIILGMQDEGQTLALGQNQCCLYHKWACNQGAISRIRNLFEEMVNDGNSSVSFDTPTWNLNHLNETILWKLYIQFEIAMGQISRAKDIFYRAIQVCPWSKSLYLYGLQYLRIYLKHEECLELMEYMTSKELHIRIDNDV